MNLYKEVQLSEHSDDKKTKRFLRYINNDIKEEYELNDDESVKGMFEKLRPNNSFSIADQMIQGLLQKSFKTNPSFINNQYYKTKNLKETLEPIRPEMLHVIELNSNCDKMKKKRYLKQQTRKRKKSKTNIKKKMLQELAKKKKPKKKPKNNKSNNNKSKNNKPKNNKSNNKKPKNNKSNNNKSNNNKTKNKTTKTTNNKKSNNKK